MAFDLIYTIGMILLFPGLGLLLAGFLLGKRKISHVVLVVGWILFGFFWLLQIPHFVGIGDTFNAIFCFLGFVAFLYFSYHELLNISWDEYLYSLNYIAGVISVASLIYYSIEKIEFLGKALIYIVAQNSIWVGNLFGMDLSIGTFTPYSLFSEPSLSINGTRISIILACTGIQSIAIFLGVLIVTRSNRKLWVPWVKKFLKKPIPGETKKSTFLTWQWNNKKKRLRKVMNMSDRSRFFRAFMYTVPVIYILNIFRNGLIIWGTENEVLGPDTFHLAHNVLSKFLSLGVLIILLFLVFDLLPESLDGIMGLMNLPKRTNKGMVKDGFIKVEKPHERAPENGKNAEINHPKKGPPPVQEKNNEKQNKSNSNLARNF